MYILILVCKIHFYIEIKNILTNAIFFIVEKWTNVEPSPDCGKYRNASEERTLHEVLRKAGD
jgi:hypothetical protein